MDKPRIIEKFPVAMDLKAGTYYWCQCGETKNNPFCDGSHNLEGKFKPVKFDLTEDKKVYLCSCKQTSSPPFCDGTHNTL